MAAAKYTWSQGRAIKSELRTLRKQGAPIGLIPLSNAKAKQLLDSIKHSQNVWKKTAPEAKKVVAPAVDANIQKKVEAPIEEAFTTFARSMQMSKELELKSTLGQFEVAEAGRKANQYEKLVEEEEAIRQELRTIEDAQRKSYKAMLDATEKDREAAQFVGRFREYVNDFAKANPNMSATEIETHIQTNNPAMWKKFDEARKLLTAPIATAERKGLLNTMKDTEGEFAKVKKQMDQVAARRATLLAEQEKYKH